MPYDLIYSSYGNNNNKQQDNSLLGKLKNDIKNGVIYSITSIELGLFTPNNYYNGAFGNFFTNLSSSLSQSLNRSLAGLTDNPIVGKFLPGAIRSLANPVFNLINNTSNHITGALTNFARDSLVAPTRNAISRFFDDSTNTQISDASSGDDSFWGSFSDNISSVASNAWDATANAASGAWSVVTNPSAALGPALAGGWAYAKNKILELLNGEDSEPYNKNLKVGDYTSYAKVFNTYPPKSKFLFKVAFFINAPYNEALGTEFYHFVYATDLPKVSFEYEPVNMYNYKTEVFKSSSFAPMRMSFYDDVTGSVTDFLKLYMKAYIPMTRGNDTKALDPRFYPIYSMDFNDDPTVWYSADATLLNNNNINVISHAIISHVFYEDNCFLQNQFVMVNPRIKSIDMGDLSYKSSDANEIKIELSYDTFFCQDSVVSEVPLYSWGEQDMFYKDYEPQLGGTKKRKYDLDFDWGDAYSQALANAQGINNQNQIDINTANIKVDENRIQKDWSDMMKDPKFDNKQPSFNTDLNINTNNFTPKWDPSKLPINNI